MNLLGSCYPEFIWNEFEIPEKKTPKFWIEIVRITNPVGFFSRTECVWRKTRKKMSIFMSLHLFIIFTNLIWFPFRLTFQNWLRDFCFWVDWCLLMLWQSRGWKEKFLHQIWSIHLGMGVKSDNNRRKLFFCANFDFF